ncbi:ABC transporter substrate-binding protein, partial [Sinorhizobium meliloti]|uniref:ABC transporter substrate-binding protein n=1 Tax=Rhizobium meliloti TaxID=382 RepID=UPI001F1C2C9E
LAFSGIPAARALDASRRTLRVGMAGYPTTFEPVLLTQTATRRVVSQMFDTLIAFDQTPAMALRPALAERWERVSARVLRVFLRAGVTFHDGRSLSVEDVAFSLSPQHLLGPKMAGQATAMATLDTIDHVEIVDNHTVIVHTKVDDTLLEKRLASWGAEIISKTAFEKAGDWNTWAAAPVGTGPYRLVSHNLDAEVVLSAHDDYWGGIPPFSGIHFRVIPEQASRMNALIAGEVDFITDLAPDMFSEIEKYPELEVAGGPVMNIRALNIDTTNPILGKVGVRRALSLALDREMFVKALWQGKLIIPNGFQLPSFGEAYIEDFPALTYDPDLARQLLREAGYNGETITYRLLNNYYPNQVTGAQVMIEMWRAVGLNVQIQMMENFGQVEKAPINAIYDTSSTATLPDPLGHAWRLFGSSSGNVKSGIWGNKEYFGLGEQLKMTTDTGERRKILRRMLEITTNDDPPCVILHASGQFYAKRRDLTWSPGQTLDLNFGPLNLAFAGR